MFSVTSETVANASFQGARSSKPDLDASAGNDSFAALVDSNTPADTGKDRAAAAADAQSAASQRRSDDASAAADAKRSRNDAAADRADRKARSDSSTRDTADKLSDADANADASQKSRTKSTNAKAGAAKSADKPAGDDAPAKSADNSDASVQTKVEPAAATPNPVVVAVTVIATATAPTVPTPGQANAPLAIAAAAIAASSAVGGDAPTAPAPVEVDPTAAASATTAAEVAAANAKTEAKAATGETVPAFGKQPTVTTDATAATDLALAASIAGTAPVSPTGKLPKDAIKNAIPATAQAVKAGGESDGAQKAADPSATGAPAAIDPNAAAPQPAATGQHKVGHDATIAGKADAANSASTAAANLSAREHSAAPEAKLASTDQGLLPANSFQPQFQTAPTSTAATALTATAATDTAVPLSGLALEIAASARSGKTSFEIRLDPADLGRIDVRIDVDRHGQVTSHLTVEKPETLSMLRQDAPQLQRALDDAGFKTGDSGLQFSLRDQSSSGQQNDSSGQGRNAQRLIVHEDDSVPATVAGRTYGRMLGSSSGVDIRI